MINVFAIDPSIFSEWEDFQCIKNIFAFSKTHLIAKFPKKWQRLVYEASVKLTTMQKKKVESWLEIAKHCLVSSNYAYDGDKDWLTNAENACLSQDKPFNDIIALHNPRNNPIIIVINDGDIDDVDRLICHYEVLMARTSEGLCKVCEPMIRYAEENILIIDPYFNGDKRYVETLKAIQKCLKYNKYIEKNNNTNYISIKVYTTIKDIESDKYKIESMATIFRKIRNNCCKYEIIFLHEDKTKYHNRFILTERFGIKFPWGLDIRDDSKPDIVNIMDENTHSVIYDQYININDSEVLYKITI